MSKEKLELDEVLIEPEAGHITLGPEAAIPVVRTLGYLLSNKNRNPKYQAWLDAAEKKIGCGPVVYDYDDVTGQIRTNIPGAVIAADLLTQAEVHEGDHEYYDAVAAELQDAARILRMPPTAYQATVGEPAPGLSGTEVRYKADTWGLGALVISSTTE